MKDNFKYISFRIFIMAIVVTAFYFLFAFYIFFKVDYLLSIYLFVSYGVMFFVIKKFIYQPYKGNLKVYKLFSSGYTIKGIYSTKTFVSKEEEEALLRLKSLVDTEELLNESIKQAHYLALQNQINPHFLYNTLEGIRSEAIANKIYNVAEMTEALSHYFRYTISNTENLVKVSDEIENIKTYYKIQEYRFGEKIKMNIDIADEFMSGYKLPKLTLQPIVENAINHGLEKKVKNGYINIKVESTEKRLLIVVSDNGVGMAEADLKEINRKLNTSTIENIKSKKSSGIAIANVNNRIHLLFGEEYGLNLFSKLNAGTSVEVSLPLIKDGEI